MRADDEDADASASARASTRSVASLVACLAALNLPDGPAETARATITERPAAGRPRRPTIDHRVGAPALAMLLIIVATPSLGLREAEVWPQPAPPVIDAT